MVGGQFMWGAVPLKKYRRCPKVNSNWMVPVVENKIICWLDVFLKSKEIRNESWV